MSDTDVANDLTCPACAAPAGETDRFCEDCGQSLLVHRTPVGGPVAGAGEASCVGCAGTEIDADGYCQDCGKGQPSGRDRMELDLRLVAGVSDRGPRRKRNEDSMAFGWVGRRDQPEAVLAVVCDGVATSENANEASQLAVDEALAVLIDGVLDGVDPQRSTLSAVSAAVSAVAGLARPDTTGTAPSSTYVSAVITPKTVTVGWIGDSRAYWLSDVNSSDAGDGGRHAPSQRLTTDHTVAEELILAGMSEEDAMATVNAHALSRWLGADAGDVEPQLVTLRPDGPGLLVVCSDGLWNYTPEAEAIVERLPAPPTEVDPMAAAVELTRVAIELGGHDNVTVVAVPLPLAATPAASAPASSASSTPGVK